MSPPNSSDASIPLKMVASLKALQRDNEWGGGGLAKLRVVLCGGSVSHDEQLMSSNLSVIPATM